MANQKPGRERMKALSYRGLQREGQGETTFPVHVVRMGLI
jgi:hypothetical protein